MKKTYETIKHFLLIIFLLVSVGLASSAQAIDPPLSILCSTFPIYQITRNIVHDQEGISVSLMLPSQLGCPHDYVLTPKDMQLLAAADILVINGLGLEEFLGAPIQHTNPKIKIIDSSKGIPDILPLEESEGSHRHEQDHDEPSSNPHLFASPRQVALIAQVIGKRLSQIDPNRSEIYLRNSQAYAEAMNTLSLEFTALANKLSSKNIITQHGVFDYLARDMGLKVVAVIESHPGHEPSASEMISLIKTAKSSQAKAIFAEPQYPSKVTHTIAKEAGITAATLDPVATGPDNAGLDYYTNVMRENMAILASTLGVQ